MSRVFFFVLLILSLSTCNSQKNAELEAINKELRAIEGKYIHDVDIFEMEIIKKRLVNLLGNEAYEDAVECFMTVTPYKISEDIFYFSGSSKLSYNSCSIAIDLKNNLFHVKIFYDESAEEKVFSENMSFYKKLPDEILE